MGSKRRIAKYILPIILKNRLPHQWYIEPFCGGCNVIQYVNGNRIANDINEYVIEMWKALVYENWQPPTVITEEQYNDIKANKEKYPKELVGFVGIACSFGAKWFTAYARNKKGTNYAMEGRSNLIKQVKRLQGTIFTSNSYYDMIIPPNSIIYCDPPYKNTDSYGYKIDYDNFWQWCKEKTKEGHIVYISEYSAPDDFECIWEYNLKSNIDAKYTVKSIEKLFKFSFKK